MWQPHKTVNMFHKWQCIVSILYLATPWFSKVHATASDSASLPSSGLTSVVGGYVPDYRFGVDLIGTARYLTDLILFSIEPTEDGVVEGSCCLDMSHYEMASKAQSFQKNEDSVRLFVSVGGAGRSAGFGNIVETPQSRQTFIANLLQLCRKKGLQGVDFDWEQPSSQEEWIGYLRLLLEASRVLHESNLLISVALHPGQRMVPQVYDVVDRVNLMTYDMITRKGGHHAEFSQAQKAVHLLVETGCPSHKVVLGIPAYARHQQHPGMVKTFAEVVDMAANAHIDESGSAHYREMIADGSFEGYSFDSPEIVAKKVQWARSNGLAGVFVWEVGQDMFVQEDSHDIGLLVQSAFLAATSLEDGELYSRTEL